VAHKTKQWHAWRGETIKDTYKDTVADLRETVLDESEFETCSKFITRNHRKRQEWLDWVNTKDNYIVDYNDFCKSPETVLKQIQTFLGLNYEIITPETKKFKEISFKNEENLKSYLISKKIIDEN
jgi:hypothetical protein